MNIKKIFLPTFLLIAIGLSPMTEAYQTKPQSYKEKLMHVVHSFTQAAKREKTTLVPVALGIGVVVLLTIRAHNKKDPALQKQPDFSKPQPWYNNNNDPMA